jgi:PAS domain S-box-containing protein
MMGAEKQKTILLVEDETIIAMTEKTTLEKFGYKVIIVNTGEEAVTAVEKTPAIDLILMDINLGTGIDGSEAAEIILGQLDLPVVFLSSHTEPEIVAKTEKITSYGYVVKNSGDTVLQASIKMAFKLFEAKMREKEKEELLQESEEKFRNLFNNAEVGMFRTRLDGSKILEFNKKYLKILNYTREEVIGKPSVNMWANKNERAKMVQMLKADGHVTDFDCDLLNKRGEVIKCVTSLRLNRDTGILEGSIQDITERKRVEAALRDSEETMRYIVKHDPNAIAVYDRHLHYIAVSDRYLQDYNVREEEIIGKHHYEVFPEMPQRWKDVHQRCLAGAIERNDDDYFERPDGSITYNRWECRPWRRGNGEIGGIITYTEVISERKGIERALRESEARAHALLSAIPDMLFRMDRCGIFLDYRADVKDLYDQSGASFIGKSCREVLPPEFADLIGQKIRTTLETGALLTFEYRLPVPGRGVRDFEARMTASGADEVTAIVRDITESEQGSKALRESEERLRGILFSMADWVWEVDENGVYTFSSEKGEAFLGSSREEIIGKTPFDFMPADEAKRVGAIFSEIVADKKPIRDLENWNIGKNGERICLLTNAVPILDEQGNLKGYRGVDKDISERKRAEEVIKSTLGFQQALLDAIPSPVFYKDAACIYLGGNRAFEKYIGLAQKQFIGKTVFDISPADLAEKYDKADKELLKNLGTQTYDASVLYADGTRHDVVFHKAPFFDAEGKVAGLVGVILDLSERKRAESQREAALAALRESEERYRSILRASPSSIALTDMGGRILMVSPAALALLGCEREEEFLGHLFTDFVAPGDRERATSSLARMSRSSATELGEYHGLRMDGSTIDLEVNGGFVMDAEGQPAQMVFVIRDITERKRAEEEIKRQLSEKETLLKEVHHRIKNNIASIGGLLSLQLQGLKNPEAVTVLQDAVGRVDSMRVLYDKLLLSEGYKDVSVKNYTESLIDTVITLFPSSVKITLEKRIDDFHLDTKKLFPLGIIINEILTNIMKYAFLNRKTGLIKISLSNADNRVLLTIQDNGRGLPVGFNINESKGFGLMLVKMLSQQLGGDFSIEAHKGTRCTIEFDI